MLVVLWYYGTGNGSGRLGYRRPGGVVDSARGEELWRWMQSLGEEEDAGGGQKNKVDWAARRERVRDAFIVSWDGYERDAWGESVRSIKGH